MMLSFKDMSRVLYVLLAMRLLGTVIFLVIVFHVGTSNQEKEPQTNLQKKEITSPLVESSPK